MLCGWVILCYSLLDTHVGYLKLLLNVTSLFVDDRKWCKPFCEELIECLRNGEVYIEYYFLSKIYDNLVTVNEWWIF